MKIYKNILPLFAVLWILVLSGCASTVRTSATFEKNIKEIKTIAVLPVDVDLFEITAGGVTEKIDQWSEEARTLIKAELESQLGDEQGFAVKFIDEDWLKAQNKELWESQSALYEAVSTSAMKHSIPYAYKTMQPFPTKKELFDYSMGADIADLAGLVDADSLLFVYGYDHKATAGRQALEVFNFFAGLYTGVYINLLSPSLLSLGLVNAETGDVEWYKITRPDVEYKFQNEKSVNKMITWLLKDFAAPEEDKKKKKGKS